MAYHNDNNARLGDPPTQNGIESLGGGHPKNRLWCHRQNHLSGKKTIPFFAGDAVKLISKAFSYNFIDVELAPRYN